MLFDIERKLMSEFLDSIPAWMWLVGTCFIVLLFLYILFRSMWRVAEPNEALIISGGFSGNSRTDEGLDFKIVTGRGVFVIPGLQTVRALDLSLYETELDVKCVTTQGIPVIVRGVVIFKIGDTQPFIANAARRFLGHQDEMKGQVYNVFEGHLRSIIGSMTVEEMIRERDKLAQNVRSASGTEMEKLGLVVDSLQIKDFEDPTNYITNLAKPHIADVEKAARIAQADADREASEREADAAALVAHARSESEIKQSAARANAEQARARANQAGPLADATARQEVVVQETEIAKLEAARQQERLNATVYKEADAAAYEKRTQAAATRDAEINGAEAAARKVELAATADARRVELAANAAAEQTRLNAQAAADAAKATAEATRVTGEAEASATTAKGQAAADAAKALAMAEAAGIEARAKALAEGQEAVIAQQIAQQLPEIVRAAASAFDNVDNMTVLNGAEGVNGMVNGIIAQVGTMLPQITAALRGTTPLADTSANNNGRVESISVS